VSLRDASGAVVQSCLRAGSLAAAVDGAGVGASAAAVRAAVQTPCSFSAGQTLATRPRLTLQALLDSAGVASLAAANQGLPGEIGLGGASLSVPYSHSGLELELEG